jgi:peptidoglycan-N-acetylglucosamine deacetylase
LVADGGAEEAGAPSREGASRDGVLFTTSWDDGHPLDIRIAAMLENFGFVGTFYASTGPDGRRLISDKDLARIGERHELGIHGRTHTIFPELPDVQLADEIEWAAAELSRFGSVGRVVAPPRGKIDAAKRHWLARLGYVVRTGAIVAGAGVVENVLEPTFQMYPHTWKTIIRNYAYRRRAPSPPLLLAIARADVPRDRFKDMLLAAGRRSPCVHVWGHAADLERLDLWGTLREVLRTAADLGLIPVSNGEGFSRLTGQARIDP